MLSEELSEKLKSIEPEIDAIKTFWQKSQISQKYEELQKTINSESFWQNPNSTAILKENQKLKQLEEQYHQVINNYQDNKDILELFASSEDELEKVKKDIFAFCKKVTKFKLELLLNKENDYNNCFLSINAGAGGTESQDWSDMLLRMYLRFCERENFKVDILDYQKGDEAGIKSATLFIKGPYAYGLLKCEAGIHRLVRISPFDANKRRHTSFSAVAVIPEVEEEGIQINEEELRIDTYRAGGAGGQHVNKTDSAVRITHIPTNIVVQCQNERSQLQNKQTALKMLYAKLKQKAEQEKDEKERSVEKKKIEWGSQIRSYVLHPYKMVKDLRTDLESPRPELILDGDLMEFIESCLLQFSSLT